MIKDLLVVLIFLFVFLFTLNQKTFAAFTCGFTTSPTTITDQMTTITALTIDGKGNFSSSNKYVWLDDYNQGGNGFTPSSDGKITIPNANQFNNKFKPPSIGVTVRGTNDIGGAVLCSFVIPITYACVPTISPTTLTPTTQITYKAKGVSTDSHKVIVRRVSDGAEMDFGEDCYSGMVLNNGISLKTFDSAQYSVETYSGCTPPGNIICPLINFSTDPGGGSATTEIGPVTIGSNTYAQAPTPTIACAQAVDSSGNCPSVLSGLGVKIPTNASGFTKTMFGVVLSLAGAIAVILIIISGYRLIASQGNPERVKEAQEQLTAAIVGLLFIIFSFVIIQFIGVDVLGIFKK